MEWAAACKIVHKRPDKVRRTLEPAHQELLERRYLRSVEYLGRGRNQIIVYTFGEEAGGVPDAEAINLLIAEGLSFTSAYSLARRFSLEHIRERVERFRAILEGGYRPKNRLGLLVDVIRDASGKYERPPRLRKPAKRQAAQEEEEAKRLEEEAAREWAEMPLEAQVRRALQVAQLVLRSRISVGELEDLARLMETGVWDPRQVVEELKSATAAGDVEAWLAKFRKALPK